MYKVTNLSLKLLDNHTLIGGTTGSGKSVFLKDLLYTLEVKGIYYNIIDLKKVSLIEYKDAVRYYATSTDDASKLIKNYLYLMDRRYKEMEQQRIDKFNGDPYYLIIDEAADLLDSNITIKSDLKRLLRLGRAAKIFVVLATQSPNRKVIPADLIVNIPNRVALRCLSQIEYRQILNYKVSGLTSLYGTCYVLTPNDLAPIMCKVYYRNSNEIKEIL